jgi:hypothetical protein
LPAAEALAIADGDNLWMGRLIVKHPRKAAKTAVTMRDSRNKCRKIDQMCCSREINF